MKNAQPSWRARAGALRFDLPASLVVFLVALPLCMGIAIASGVPPSRGIISGIIGGLVVGLFSGAPLQVSGPAAGLTVLVWQLVERWGLEGLGIAVLCAGLLQVLAGAFKAGQWFRAVSPAVIHGMLAGIGVLIFASQFHVMLDDTPKGSGVANLFSIPVAIWDAVYPLDGSPHHMAAAAGIVTLVSLILWGRFAPRRLRVLPAALVGVLAGSAVAGIFAFDIKFVGVPANLLDEVMLPTASGFSLLLQPTFLGAILGLALIASAETLLSAAAVDKMHDGPRASFDKELLAQGLGNSLCGVAGALPLTGVIIRSSANVQAGAKTRASAVMHGAWILVFVVAFPSIIGLVPTSALAGILVYTGYRLAHPKVLGQLAKHGRGEVVVFLATVVGVVGLDLLSGVAIGFALAAAKNLLHLADLDVHLDWSKDGTATLHLEGAATFLSLPRLAAVLQSLPPGAEVKVTHDRLRFLDAGCLELLEDTHKQLEDKGGGLRVDWMELSTHRRLKADKSSRDTARAVSVP